MKAIKFELKWHDSIIEVGNYISRAIGGCIIFNYIYRSG